MNKRIVFLGLMLLVIAATSCPTAGALERTYVENFSTQTYRDTVLTTAVWDTVAGEISPQEFGVSLAGGLDTPGYATSVAVHGDVAFVTDYYTLVVLDISVPSAPDTIGNFETSADPYHVAVSGDVAYLSVGYDGVQVLDVSDPAAPSVIGSHSIPSSYAVFSCPHGDLLLVAAGYDGLLVFDVADPALPSLLGTYVPGGEVLGVAVEGDVAYLASNGDGVVAVDISDPSNPAYVGDNSYFYGAYSVAVSGDRAFVADGASHELGVLDISDPAAPSVLDYASTLGTPWEVEVCGDRLYLADYSSGVHCFDVSDPADIALEWTFDTAGFAYDVVRAGEYLYVADYQTGVQVLDVLDTMPPVKVGEGSIFYDTEHVVVRGDYAFTTDFIREFCVFDISDPTQILITEWSSVSGAGRGGIDVAGNFAYVSMSSGLAVIDITDPTAAVHDTTFPMTDCLEELCVRGDVCFAALNDGLAAIDITDPTEPSLLGQISFGWSPTDLCVAGDVAYVLDSTGDLFVIDVSDPSAPSQIAVFAASGTGRDIKVAGDCVYLMNSSALDIVDVSNPSFPVLLSSTPELAGSGVAVSGDIALATSLLDDSISFVDVSSPEAPVVLAVIPNSDGMGELVFHGDYALVTQNLDGLACVRVFQDVVDTGGYVAASTDIESDGNTAVLGRVSPTAPSCVAWELSGDGGITWDLAPEPNSWFLLSSPGSDLRWRSTLHYGGTGAVPTATGLTVEWKTDFPVVMSVTDVPDDQGGQVSLAWERSGHDFPGSPQPITGYALYRRVDFATREESPGKIRQKLETMAGGPETLYPPGSWHYLMTVPAAVEETYAAVVPTLFDSTASGGLVTSTYFVRALTATPGVYIDSAPDSGYSVDNLAPTPPAAFALDYSASQNALSWEESEEEDFQFYRVYRSTDPEFVPSPSDVVHETTDIAWNDTVEEGWQYHYRVTALDFSGNESDPASPEAVTGIDGAAPKAYALAQNVPNPFNPVTTIAYAVPDPGGDVTIRVYDAGGRLVRSLANGWSPPGRHSVVWDGRDERGVEAATGVYFCRMEAPGFADERKLLLLK